ncbi:MAG: hypothetical protein D6692_06295 [Planctomycetota bacterium]|nr:MAG: hypothetical protein D6692_06295 [Planctomycetota bacterium]
MDATPFIAVLALVFLALLAVRVAILLILRRDESGPPEVERKRWPDATVIKAHDTPPHEKQP